MLTYIVPKYVFRKVVMLHVLRRFKPLRFLLSLDLLFIALHLLVVTSAGEVSAFYNRFTVDRDHGFAELYQYLKFSLIAGLLGLLFVRRHAWTYAVWALIFAFALFDDALSLHENGGGFLVRSLDIPSALGLRGQDFGELIVWGAVGVAALGALWASYKRAAPELRGVSRQLGCRFALLSFFGLVVDQVHSLTLGSSAALQQVFVILEDGGEMVVASLIVAFVWRLAAEKWGHRGILREPPRQFEQANPQRARVYERHS